MISPTTRIATAVLVGSGIANAAYSISDSGTSNSLRIEQNPLLADLPG